MYRGPNVHTTWRTIPLRDEEHAFDVFADLKGKRWLSRGQARRYCNLTPRIDRDGRDKLLRPKKLQLERESISLFQSTARFFADNGERQSLQDDVVALMVLQHYGVPTRLLDWTGSPYVAGYFGASGHDSEAGEIWTFNEPLYEVNGRRQWQSCPQAVIDEDPNRFDAKLTMFSLDVEAKCDWIICGFYPPGFPRQNAQQGAYTMTAHFNRDHAIVMARLLEDSPSHFCRYTIPSSLKPKLLTILRERHGIWRGSLFPDTAGAADTAKLSLFRDGDTRRAAARLAPYP
jgi:hypothetical protein